MAKYPHNCNKLYCSLNQSSWYTQGSLIIEALAYDKPDIIKIPRGKYIYSTTILQIYSP